MKQFEEVPEILHAADPNFVPPFPGSITKIFSAKSPFRKHGELFPFLALREGKPVGRIAAILNRSHNAFYKDQLGFFGFFDFADDLEVSRALYSKVREVLSSHGCQAARGPYNPTLHDECGVLVEGFDRPPFVMMTYNPSYYERHYNELGLNNARNLFAYYLSAEVTAPERIGRIVARVKTQTGIQLRNVNLKKLNEELKIIHRLYNETLNRNWGFFPITYEDLQASAADLRAIVDPSMVLIAEKEGKPVGFSLTIPNINELLLKTRNHNRLWKTLKFTFLLFTRHPGEARLAVLGVSPEFRNRGIGALFYHETLMRGKHKYKGGELSWIDEDNGEMIRAIETMGGKRYRTYRIFEAKL